MVYATFDEMGGDPDHDNDLQRAAISLHPRSGAAVRAALQAGATHAFVSGSGPSVVAFAPDAARLQAIANAWRESAAVDRIIAADAPLPQRCRSIPHSPHQRQPLTLWW